MKGINLKNVYKDYFGTACVTDINFEISNNETVVLAGPLGSGKSVILRLIAGIENVSEGEICFNGELCNNVSLKKRNAAMVFKKNSYFKKKSPYYNLAYGLRLRKTDKEIIDEKVNSAARILDLQVQDLNKRQKNLSEDVKQLINTARAVVRKPYVLLMDEPFSTLGYKQTLEKFNNLLKAFPVACIYATRNFDNIRFLNKKTIVLKDGIIQQAGNFEDIYNNPANKFVADFLSNPKINFYECLIKKENQGLTLELLDQKFELPEDFVKFEFLEKPLIIGIRPEDILLKEAENCIGFKCRINYIDREEGVLIGSVKDNGIIIKTGADVKPGEIYIYFNLDKIFLFDKETELNIRSTNG